MSICLPPGHLRCRWLCFFSRTQAKNFNSNRCSLSIISCQSMGTESLLWHNSDFAMTIWRFWISKSVCFVIILIFAIDCSNTEFCARVCVCVCVRKREREGPSTALCVCVCVLVWERETRSHNCGLCTANTYELQCLSRDSVPLLGLNW